MGKDDDVGTERPSFARTGTAEQSYGIAYIQVPNISRRYIRAFRSC
jgi:hypothetical protein